MAIVNILAPKPLNINERKRGSNDAGYKKRVCTILSIMGKDAVKVFDTFEYEDGESEDSVPNKFEEHCNPTQHTIHIIYE